MRRRILVTILCIMFAVVFWAGPSIAVENEYSSECIGYDGKDEHHMEYSVEFTEEDSLIIDMKVYYYDDDDEDGIHCNLSNPESLYNIIFEWDFEAVLMSLNFFGLELTDPKVTVHNSGSNADGLTWWYNFIGFCGKSNGMSPAWVPNTDIDITGLDCTKVYNVPPMGEEGPFPGFVQQPSSDDVWYLASENPLSSTGVYTLVELIELLGFQIPN